MKEEKRHFLARQIRRVLRLLPVVAAVVVVALLVRSRSGPARKPPAEVGRPLLVIDVPVVALVPRASGYGLAEPVRVWRAVAEVKGTVVEIHPLLVPGSLVKAGTVLVKLHPGDYELALARWRAAVAETRAKLAELVAEGNGKQASLAIEKRSFALAQRSLERMRTLLKSKATTPDQLDREERTVLQQEQLIQQLEAALALVPARRDALEAALAGQQANLDQAQIDLERTTIQAPFDCRLGEVNLQQGQFLAAGQVLFEAHGTAVVEVQAMFRPEQMRRLLDADRRRQLQPGVTMATLRELFDLAATVHLHSGEWEATWPARFDRIREAVDPRTRAIQVVGVVDDPYGQIVPGVRPALVRGMYCELRLRAPARPGTVVVPRSAVRDGRVHLVDAGGRLRARAVRVAFAQDDFAVVEEGLAGGETVVVSDPVPAIEGMKVEPTADPALLRRIVEQAEGGGRGQ